MELWNQEYPLKLNYHYLEDFKTYLNNLTDQSHILLLDEGNKVIGWYFDFLREGERWFAILLNSDVHRKGFGTKLLQIAKEKESILNGWVIDHNEDIKPNGDPYISPLDFYTKNDFKVISETRLELEKISAVKIKWQKNQDKNV